MKDLFGTGFRVQRKHRATAARRGAARKRRSVKRAADVDQAGEWSGPVASAGKVIDNVHVARLWVQREDRTAAGRAFLEMTAVDRRSVQCAIDIDQARRRVIAGVGHE